MGQRFASRPKAASRPRKPDTNKGVVPLFRAGRPYSLSPQDRIETAELLREIKDIRDELKMLRVIAETQRSIQEEFRDFVRIKPRTLAYKDVADELREMDKAVEQIATSVSITLNPQQNAAAIAQTDAAVYQGQIMLLFTAVTIVFVGDGLLFACSSAVLCVFVFS
ncbi:hypothetical protein G3M48_000514 [Beauveria asiatica]|uniref:Uncharacterized protein n=1 Tax=Beauveria asiatica TaxID=1069075 RepID=A0AAW0S1A3_9HYPO